MGNSRLVCGNEITPRRVVAGLELSEGITSKTEPSKGVRSGREQS